MNLDVVRELTFPRLRQRYDARDSALYALSLGIGDDPLDPDELPYVYEGLGQLAAPSQCVTLCWPPLWHRDPATGISWRRILHGEQSFVLHRPLPVEGDFYGDHRILAVEDKGASRGAVVQTARELFDAATGARVASLRQAEFLRDDGGCGGFGASAPLTRPIPAGAEPTAVLRTRTSTQAALLYRQASRDYMPIHADPEVARQAGFDRPIAHGLNIFGIACRAALKHLAPGRPERLTSMAARFVSPTFPGDTIVVELFRLADGIRFRAHAEERQTLVLDRGEITLERGPSGD